MRKNYNAARFAGIVLILIIVISSCKTAQKVQNAQVIPGTNFDTVFFFTDGGIGMLGDAAESARTNQMKIFTVINFPGHTDAGRMLPLHVMKTNLKNEVRNLVTNYEIDGLGIQMSDLSPELIEVMVVESMLLKPYLINFIIYSGEDEYKRAAACLSKGIVDRILPESDIKTTNTLPHGVKVNLPGNLKKVRPEQVIGLDLSLLFPVNSGGNTLQLGDSKKTIITDSDGYIGFVATKPDTLELVTDVGSVLISTENWVVPYKYTVQPDGKSVRKSPWVEFRKIPGQNSNVPEFDLLCKTDYPAKVSINGESVKQYKTGIFFRKITLKEGQNRVRATVMTQDSASVFYEREFNYEKSDNKRESFPLWIDARSVEPVADLELLKEDIVRISFQGSPGQEAYVQLFPGKTRLKCSREDHEDYSLYRADLYISNLKAGKPYRMNLELIPHEGDGKTELKMSNTLMVRNLEDYPLVRVKNENSRLTYNMGAPRLGGPIRSELEPGVVMKTNGKTGDNYRVRLTSFENGFIHKDDVEILPVESILPLFYITSMSCGPSVNADILSIPYPEPVPYEVYPEPDLNRIVVTLFGVQTSSTWITHMAGRRMIDRITWEQTTPETYRIFVNLKAENIWGYDIRTDGKRLVMSVKYPPVYRLDLEKPLAGLKISIEAGHGGTSVGATGLSGLSEKDINLDLSFRLGEICRSMGAEVIQVRDSDKDMSLIEKRDIAKSSGADMLISIHANAGGRGYLSVSGTSTYWNNPFWAPLAEDIYERLLGLDLKEFGVVGSFNYTVTRVSQMPSVLVEQAFMSHAEDEEKLADPQFRQQMAEKIYEGIIDYLKSVKP